MPYDEETLNLLNEHSYSKIKDFPINEEINGIVIEWRKINSVQVSNPITIKSQFFEIKQGTAQDSALIAGLIGIRLYEISFQKNYLSSIIIPALNRNNAYFIRININGCFRLMEINDFIPFDKDTNSSILSSTKSNEIWLPLLEKAFLNLYGFENLKIKSNPAHQINYLLGW